LKYKTLHHIARHIDHLIDHNLVTKNSTFIQQESLKKLVLANFPDLFVMSFGWHKIAFGVRSLEEEVVLKVGAKRVIENDHIAYKRVPESMRHMLFAKIFWHTKYCLLQEYGYPAQVTPNQLVEVRRLVYGYGIFDVKAENLKRIDGKLKIVDANVTRFLQPTILRKVDEAKSKMPKRLISVIRKFTRPFYEG
jgi:hypothetical protein